MCDGGYTLCGTRATSIPSQRVSVADQEHLRHLASARLTCMGMHEWTKPQTSNRIGRDTNRQQLWCYTHWIPPECERKVGCTRRRDVNKIANNDTNIGRPYLECENVACNETIHKPTRVRHVGLQIGHQRSGNTFRTLYATRTYTNQHELDM